MKEPCDSKSEAFIRPCLSVGLWSEGGYLKMQITEQPNEWFHCVMKHSSGLIINIAARPELKIRENIIFLRGSDKKGDFIICSESVKDDHQEIIVKIREALIETYRVQTGLEPEVLIVGDFLVLR